MTVSGFGRPTLWLLPALVVVTLGAGCVLAPFDPTPDPEAGPGLAGDCAPPLVLHEETTLGALGLAQFDGLGPELDRRGSVRITEATMRWEDFAPAGVGALVAEGQLLCVTWPDGSGLSTLLHEPFRSPGAEVGTIGGFAESPVLIGVGVVVLLVVAVSWLAFRSERPSRRP